MKIQSVNSQTSNNRSNVKNNNVGNPQFGNLSSKGEQAVLRGMERVEDSSLAKKFAKVFSKLMEGPELASANQKRYIVSKFRTPQSLKNCTGDIVVKSGVNVDGFYQAPRGRIDFRGNLSEEGVLSASNSILAISPKMVGKIICPTGDVQASVEVFDGLNAIGKNVSIRPISKEKTGYVARKVVVNATEDAFVSTSLGKGSSVKGRNVKFSNPEAILENIRVSGKNIYVNSHISSGNIFEGEHLVLGPDATFDKGASKVEFRVFKVIDNRNVPKV